ncbi:MAG: nodulation protein NodZ [Acidobacteriota bacterium]|nr:nodulation protein NodZ [Acidobacteriota bacterium]
MRGQVAAARLGRGLHLGAVAARIRTPEVAVLECRSGADESGLFSEFAAVIGLLDHYERWRHLYAGVRVQFGHGLYFDAAVGPNWWEYYFAPIDIRDRAEARARAIDPHYHDLCANRVERTMARVRGAALVQQHVTVRQDVNDIVDNFIGQHWTGHHVIGVHYRGTDKSDDARRVPYEEVASVVHEAMRRAGTERCRVFLATDEQAFVDFMRTRFSAQLCYREMFRSIDGRPIDVVNSDGNHRKGLDAVVDCLLLSRSHTLIRTASNLSLCATLFNPRVPDMLLNPER